MGNLQDHLKSQQVTVRPATMHDKKSIFEWLAHSDTTSSMMGPPNFPDNPIPTWEEFVRDYHDYFFDGSKPLEGRCFIIEVAGKPIGQINYNEIQPADHSVELDIWLAGSEHTGKGYGTDAILALCDHLHSTMDCHQFILAPSARNTRAIRSYSKAGFVKSDRIPLDFQPDYEDTVVMVKHIK